MKQSQKSQKHKVIQKLRADGEVSRNWCLSQYISRLSAIIQVLESEGYIFETKTKDGDYVYKIKDAPKRVVRMEIDPITRIAKPIMGI